MDDKTKSLGEQLHNYNMTLPPREAIIYALSVRFPGEWCTLQMLASLSRQNPADVDKILLGVRDELRLIYPDFTDQLARVCTKSGGSPKYMWLLGCPAGGI